MASINVLILEDGESWSAFLRRIRESKGDVLIVLTGPDELIAKDKKERESLLKLLKSMSGRVRVATKNRVMIAALRGNGIRVVDRVKDVRQLLAGSSDQLDEVLRLFSPHIWRQQLRSRLQAMGLLALPKLRIWTLIAVSAVLFFFVMFKLLPSAEINVDPREETVTRTANIFLVQSGATVDIPQRVRTMELKPIVANVTRQLTFNEISKEFIGDSSQVTMKIVNKSGEKYSLRKGSRLANQAGMVFRVQSPINIEAGEELEVLAIADDLDLYGEIMGERGNVPAGLKWEFVGLAKEEGDVIYATNLEEGSGGRSEFRTVLHEGDLNLARKQLEKELLTTANQQIDEQIELANAEDGSQIVERLYYDELTKIAFTGFVMPTQFIGQKVSSVPIEGTIIYTAYAYDTNYVLELLKKELLMHTETGKEIDQSTITLDRLVTHVINYEDDLSWIKLTVDLSGIERAILDPLTPEGARFASKLREAVLGKTVDEAKRIVSNFPDVEKASVSVWPPWNRKLPTIPYHITIVTSNES